MKVCLLWCCVCMQCIWELCCFNVSSKGTLSCTVTLPSGLIDRAHIKAERESNTFRQEVRGGAQPRLLSKNPACFPVFCFLACRVQKSDLLCILEKSLGEVRGRPWSWPLQWQTDPAPLILSNATSGEPSAPNVSSWMTPSSSWLPASRKRGPCWWQLCGCRSREKCQQNFIKCANWRTHKTLMLDTAQLCKKVKFFSFLSGKKTFLGWV